MAMPKIRAKRGPAHSQSGGLASTEIARRNSAV